jgi:hypothetical protein
VVNDRFSSIRTTMWSIPSRRLAASSSGAGIVPVGVGGIGSSISSMISRQWAGGMWLIPRSAARSARSKGPLMRALLV